MSNDSAQRKIYRKFVIKCLTKFAGGGYTNDYFRVVNTTLKADEKREI